MSEKICLHCGGPVLENLPQVEMGNIRGYLCGESGNRCWQRLGEEAFLTVGHDSEEGSREKQCYFEGMQV